jgi:hypothetical protein
MVVIFTAASVISYKKLKSGGADDRTPKKKGKKTLSLKSIFDAPMVHPMHAMILSQQNGSQNSLVPDLRGLRYAAASAKRSKFKVLARAPE